MRGREGVEGRGDEEVKVDFMGPSLRRRLNFFREEVLDGAREEVDLGEDS